MYQYISMERTPKNRNFCNLDEILEYILAARVTSAFITLFVQGGHCFGSTRVRFIEAYLYIFTILLLSILLFTIFLGMVSK